MSILIGTGLHYPAGGQQAAQEFFNIWMENTLRHVPASMLSRIVVLGDSGCTVAPGPNHIMLGLQGDVGHFMLTLHGHKKHHFNGWMASVLALAMIAYNDEADFCYKESDALAFGPWVERIYEQLDQASVIFGSYQRPDGTHVMACAQSLFLVRHSYIPTFCRLILEGPPQNTDSQLGENVFARLEREHSWDFKRFTFGYDRGRPFNVADEVFYVQHCSPEDMALLREANLI